MNNLKDQVTTTQTRFLANHPGHGLDLQLKRLDNQGNCDFSGRVIQPNGMARATAHITTKVKDQNDIYKAYLDIMDWLNVVMPSETTTQTIAPAVSTNAKTQPKPMTDGRRDKAHSNAKVQKGSNEQEFAAQDVETIVRMVKDAFTGCGAGKEFIKGDPTNDKAHFEVDWSRDKTSARIVVLKEGLKILGDGFLKSTFAFTESEQGVFTKTITAGCLQPA